MKKYGIQYKKQEINTDAIIIFALSTVLNETAFSGQMTLYKRSNVIAIRR